MLLLNLRKGDHVKKDKKIITNKRRSFIKKAGLLTLGAAGATTVKAPYASLQQIQLNGDYRPILELHLVHTLSNHK